MIEYDNEDETMTIICDSKACGAEEELEGDWNDCIDQAKQLGWRVKKVGEEWLHFCPDDARSN